MLDAEGCANCGRASDAPGQKFCPSCGQATPARRIDWHFMLHELEHSVLHMDRGILYSLKELMLRPGRLMRDYLEGRRARQAKPFLLLMVMAAAVVFLGKGVLGGNVVEPTLSAGTIQAAGLEGEAQAMAASILQAWATVQGWMNRNFTLWTLLLIPLEALAFRLAFHRVGGLNYPEWLVLTAFITVQTFVFWGLAMPLQRWFPHAQGVAIALGVGYAIYSLARFFDGYPRWKSVLRALVGFGLYMLASTLVTGALVVALVVSWLRG